MFGFSFGRDTEKPRKPSKFNRFMREVAIFAKRRGHKGLVSTAVVSKAWNKETQKPHKNWHAIVAEAFVKGGRSGKSGGKSVKGRKTRRGMPFRMAGFKSANTWLDSLIGVVKAAVSPKHRMRGSDYLLKHKVKLEMLERKLDQGIVVLKRKEADEDSSRAERAKATADRKAAQAAKKDVVKSKAQVIAVIRSNGTKAHVEKGESEDEYEDRVRRGVSGPRRPDRWVEGDKAGKSKGKGKGKKGKGKKGSAKKKSSTKYGKGKGKKGSAKKKSSAKHGKGRHLSTATKAKMKATHKRNWKRVEAYRKKGMSLGAARKKVTRENKAKKAGKKPGRDFGRDYGGFGSF